MRNKEKRSEALVRRVEHEGRSGPAMPPVKEFTCS